MSSLTFRSGISAVGEFYALAADTARAAVRTRFHLSDFGEQSVFVMRVSLLPTALMALPFTVLVVFTLNALLGEIGARDLAGAGAGFGAVTQIGPLVTVLVVAGAGATAICADLGSRTIREEIDAMEVLGIDPIQRLIVPRVAALTFIATLLNAGVCSIGIVGGYVFSSTSREYPPAHTPPA